MPVTLLVKRKASVFESPGANVGIVRSPDSSVGGSVWGSTTAGSIPLIAALSSATLSRFAAPWPTFVTVT